ncbi:hypothetical protein MOKP38_46340 [Mycobacterium avium subsp. hominissuis]
MKIVVAVLGMVVLALSAPANADPGEPPICNTSLDQCQPGQVIYCPDTGGFISRFSGSCPSLWVGPYGPGNPSGDN